MRKTYRQFCGVARALDLVGERWTLLIVRELILGERRYNDLLDALPGITTNLLANRLSDLQEAQIIEKTHSGGYVLTERGKRLEPAIMALGAWGWETMADGPRKGDRVDLNWLMVSLKRRFQWCGADWIVEIRGTTRTIQLEAKEGNFFRTLGTSKYPDIILRGEDPWFRAFFLGLETLASLVKAGRIDIIEGASGKGSTALKELKKSFSLR